MGIVAILANCNPGTSPLEFAFNSMLGYVTSEALVFPVILPTPLLGESCFKGQRKSCIKKKRGGGANSKASLIYVSEPEALHKLKAN